MAKRAALKLADMKARKGEPLASSPETPVRDAAEAEPRRGQTLRLPLAAWRQLKLLAIDQGRPAHDLLVEAVNDLFTKHDKPPIA